MYQRLSAAEEKAAQEEFTISIWDTRYYVRVPYMASTDEAYHRLFGVPSTGNKDYDKELSKQLIDTVMTIDQMVEHHKKSIPISLVNRNDVKKIYDSVDKYLQYWRHRLETTVNYVQAPMQDLIDMDNFATTLYDKYAKFDMKPLEAISPFMSFLHNYRAGLFKTHVNNETLQVEDETLPDRNSFASIFKKRLVGSKPWNKS